MFIDSHCHLQDKKFSRDLDNVLERAGSTVVEKIICVGTSLKDSKEVLRLSEKYNQVFATVGIYPNEEVPDGDFREELITLAKHRKVVAIGECGLDYSDQEGGRQADLQKALFRKQIGTAIQLDLPLVIHNRNADEDILLELSHYKTTGKLKGVFHCFTSDIEFAKKVLDLGFYISFTAMITYPSAKHLEDVIKFIPNDRLLAETDAPYLPPQTHRGERNEPMHVKMTAEKMAQVKGISHADFYAELLNNTQNLFTLN